MSLLPQNDDLLVGEHSEATTADPGRSTPAGPSGARPAWRRLLRNRSGVAALTYLLLLIVAAIGAPVLAPHAPNVQDVLHAFSGASGSHLLGTDDLGRDVLSRLIYGARIALQVSFEAVGLGLAIGIVVGLVAGYRGGKLDFLLMRLTDAGLSFPPLVLALAVVGVLGAGVGHISLALAAVLVPAFARLARAQTLAVSAETFVEASRSIGTRTRAILIRRVLPNISPPIIVQAAQAMGAVLLAEAGLSFLGLGAPQPTADWGTMLREAYDTALFTHPWSVIVPGAAIALTILAFNTLGDALRDTFGPEVVRPRRSFRALGRRRARTHRGLTTVAPIAEVTDLSSPDPSALLEIRGLSLELMGEGGPVRVVDDVDLVVSEREVVGLVGESGAGKSVTALSILRLLPSPPWLIHGGAVRLRGSNLLELDFRGMRGVRGKAAAMIFQDPMSSLNPSLTVGAQLVEALRLHDFGTRRQSEAYARELLGLVGMGDVHRNMASYAHQLSGGMRQRVMIAMALSCRPSLLIADEPTTALDVTIQAGILALLRSLAAEMGLAVILVTHDLAVVGEVCDSLAVMYAGQIVERGPVSEVFRRPRHPYTAALLSAAPHSEAVAGPLPVIPGSMPAPGQMPGGCRFNPRCSHATDRCRAIAPSIELVAGGQTRCLRHDELVLPGVEAYAREF